MSWLSSQFPQLSEIHALESGGQKSVFRAKHESHGAVVLKLFHPNADVERARREILAVQQIVCDRIPKVLDAGIVRLPIGDLIWLIEVFVDARSLRHWLRLDTALGDVTILTLAKGILEALAAAEAASIVHRDVKPENILMHGDGTAWPCNATNLHGTSKKMVKRAIDSESKRHSVKKFADYC